MSPQKSLLVTTCLQLLIQMLLCFTEVTGEIRTRKFIKLEGYHVKDIIKTIKSTKLQCCRQCFEDNRCVSVNFREDSTGLNCDLNWKSPFDASVTIEESANWNVFYMDNDNRSWKLVFRLTAGGTTNAYQAWKDGNGTTDSNDCMKLYPPLCRKYYRHKLLDNWETWPIDQVKFALYENHTQVAYITFNGSGSDMESWFSKQRVLESSWSDIMGSTQMLFFSIQGDPGFGRHFFIHEAYGGCNIDVGWTVTATGINPPCFIDVHVSYPGLVYARNGTKALYYSQGFGVADVLAVYVKLQEA